MSQWGVKGLFGAQGVGGVCRVTCCKAATVEDWIHMSGTVGMLGMRYWAILFGYLRMHLMCVTLLMKMVSAEALGGLFTWAGISGGDRKRGKWRSGSVAEPSRDIFELEFDTTSIYLLEKANCKRKPDMVTTAHSTVPPPKPKRKPEPMSNIPPLIRPFLLRQVLKRRCGHGLRLLHGPEDFPGISSFEILLVGVLLPRRDQHLGGLEPTPF